MSQDPRRVTLQRCARLLAGDIASWVIVDVERSGQLRRQFVVGPHGERPDELARKVRAVDPQPDSVPAQVHSAGRSVGLAHADDAGLLGADPDGTPLLMLLGVTSLLSVPISDAATSYGVLTLARRAAEDRFVTAKLAYLRRDGDHLRVELASSGHPGPAVVRPDGRVDVLSGGGLPLGLFPDAEPARETLELGQDDLLFFYSDGVTDARSPDMQYFEDRLAGAAGRTASQTTRMVQDLIARFCQDDLRDDMTILVARVTSPPEAS